MASEHEIVLRGCRPTPLASYLKALGVLRLVSQQAGGASTTGWWEEEVFHLRSSLNEEDLVQFFLEDYRPTPIMAPWNGGSGFFPKGPKDNKRIAVESILYSRSERFAIYRRAISVAEAVKERMKLESQPQKEAKE
ncbi:MAG: type I-U CRISPR-associated protein Csx17, partial [Alicyclobacillus sp.]|nr:type I-U CRISPR-associated protein Csx17 [Alicyclobacillus sp.]